MRSRSRIVLSGLILMLILGASSVAKAAPGFTIGCLAIGLRASPAPVGLAIANPSFFPCAPDEASLASVPIPGVATAGVLVSQTAVEPNIGARSSVAQVTVTLGGTTIELAVVRSVALCQAGGPAGFTKIAKLDINGRPVADLNVPPNTGIAVPGVPLTITLNRQEEIDAGPLTLLRVAAIEIAFTDPANPASLVVAESYVLCFP